MTIITSFCLPWCQTRVSIKEQMWTRFLAPWSQGRKNGYISISPNVSTSDLSEYYEKSILGLFVLALKVSVGKFHTQPLLLVFGPCSLEFNPRFFELLNTVLASYTFKSEYLYFALTFNLHFGEERGKTGQVSLWINSFFDGKMSSKISHENVRRTNRRILAL